jgi:uncharacterized protein YdbL (DUF1318 family)
MIRLAKTILPKTALIAAALAAATPALAADPIVEQALAAGTIGEQWDGYLGFVSTPSGDLKAAVDAINIKRREIGRASCRERVS